ncbi:methyltransferase [Streptomonospora wellingtoniae]|uniref:Methyltransferase n=1 Tax=Streptomonospora wellingtoniae TaxID=3075544 RepID=A0ABU2KXI7_9ACTN|nr:methyltransferase [Streptomonospora sp. DSM 45055]MDT0303926.1 methyltransferase [Streptomonospora sp. DSM 45055]
MTEQTAEQQTQADISRMKELAWGLTSTAALVAAIDLRVAEALDAGPRQCADLAQQVEADPTTLQQLMDALVSRDVFERRDDGTYEHNGLSRLLRQDDANSVAGIVKWIGYPELWRLWPRLTDAVREGKPQSVEVYGKDFFRYIHEDEPQAAQALSNAMTGASNHTSEQVAKSLDLSRSATVADIGGGQGHLISTVLRANPHLRGTLLDLEGVVAEALPALRSGGELADRAAVIGMDCRDDVPVEADVYLLKNILEWDDASTLKTLQNVRRNARPGARVVVVETLTDRTPEPMVTTSLDLLLLVNVGGRKHSSQHVEELFTRSGIRFDSVRPTGTFLAMAEGTVTE